VCEDRTGAIWIGSYDGGLNRWQDGIVDSFPVPTQTPGNFIFSIYPGSFGDFGSAAAWRTFLFSKMEKLRPPPTTVHGVKSISLTSQGCVWLGRKNGGTAGRTQAARMEFS